MNVVVVGGGIAGLAAAYEAAKRGATVRLLESSRRAGGLIHTTHVDGFTIEDGPESILAQKPAALALCQELGLGSRLLTMRQPRTSFVLADGRLYPLPSPGVLGIPLTLDGIVRYDLLPIAGRLRLAMEPFVRARRGTDDESVASFFGRRFGRATVDLVAEPLLGGIHAGGVSALSMRSLFPRLLTVEAERGSVLRGLRGTTPDADGAFRSLVGGMSELVDAISARLPDGTLRLSTPVTAVERREAGWRVATPDGPLDADVLVLAVPAHVAARLLAPIDDDASRLCGAVPYVSTAGVSVAWPRARVAHPLAGSGFVVARVRESSRLTACTWTSSKWDHRAPDGTVLLRAFLGGVHDPGAADLDDDTLVDLVVRDLARIHGIQGPPLLTRVHRWRNAGARHEVGHEARIRALDARLALLPRLRVTGSGYRAIGIPDNVSDGRAVGAAAAQLQ